MTCLKSTDLIKVDPLKCQRCGCCEKICPGRVFSWFKEKTIICNFRNCMDCGHCQAVCPSGAIFNSRMPEDEFSPVAHQTLEDVFKSRRSCRAFLSEPLKEDEVDSLIEQTRWAPTAKNGQNVTFMIMTGKKKAKLAKLTANHYLELNNKIANPLTRTAVVAELGKKTVDVYGRHLPILAKQFEQVIDESKDNLFFDAPVVIVMFASGLPHLASANCNLAAMQLMLVAEVKGFATCYNGYALTALVREQKSRRAIGIKNDQTPGAVIALGRPVHKFNKIPPRKPRRIIW